MIKYSEYDCSDEYELLCSIWNKLYCKEKHSFFLSWSWIGTWINTLPKNLKMNFVVGYDKSEAVVVFLKGIKKKKFCCIPLIRYMSVNTSGDYRFDNVMLEYNAFLTADQDLVSLQQLMNSDFSLQADVVSFPAFIRLPKSIDFLDSENMIIEELLHPSYFVDLSDVKESESGYLGLLNAGRRRQLKRSLQLLGMHGDVSIAKAKKKTLAISMFDEMLELHRISWSRRGETGVFENSFTGRFHRNLLSQDENGEVCIFKISAGDIVIGYIYGFVSQNRFIYYQSGFKVFTDNKIKAGLCCHALLINYLSRTQLDRYDFLSGGQRYKESLSTGKEYLSWLRVYRKKWMTSFLLNTRKIRRLRIEF